MTAICPKCRSEFPDVGCLCENDGFFSVPAEELVNGSAVLGRPLGGSFVALRKIGQGGMGTVYEGKQIQFDRVVAIKVLSHLHITDEQIVARFEREARSVARVMHPNVVQLISSGIENGDIAYIVMEYVKGVELSNISPQVLSGQFIFHVADQVLNALSEAHAMHVIHRDLKPDNIMITEQDGDPHFVKVLDFGLATLTDRAKLTMSGQALGTPWYMSPEQATASDVTEASDIYSLGCVLYELAAAKPPFPGNRPYNVMMQHVNAAVPPLKLRPEVELSPEMIAFILKCLEKAPEDRYRNAQEAHQALHRLPEWAAAGQSDPNQSLRMSMQQLSEIGRSHSEAIPSISSSINAVLESGESPSLRLAVEIPSNRMGRSLSLTLDPNAMQANAQNIQPNAQNKKQPSGLYPSSTGQFQMQQAQAQAALYPSSSGVFSVPSQPQPQYPSTTGQYQMQQSQPQYPSTTGQFQMQQSQPQYPSTTGQFQMQQSQPQYPSTTGQFQMQQSQPQYPPTTGQFQMQQPQPQYPSSSGVFPTPQQPYPSRSGAFPVPQQPYPSSSGVFPVPQQSYPSRSGMIQMQGQYPPENIDNCETVPLIDGALVAHLHQVKKDARERMIVKILVVIVLILAVTAIVLQIIK